MRLSLLRGFLHLARIDRAVAYTLANRVWMLASNALTMLLLVHFLSGAQQGLYFTFQTLLGLHVVFDLGVSFTVTQWVARERAGIVGVGPAQRVAEGCAKLRVAHMAGGAIRQVAALAVLFFGFGVCVGPWLFANDPQVVRSAWLTPWVLVTVATAWRLPLLAVEGVLEGLGMVSAVARVRLAGLVTGTLALWAVLVAGGGLWGMAASALLAVLVPAALYARRFGLLLRDLASVQKCTRSVNWRAEVWPFQWKYASTMLTGFVVANLFNPAVYYFQGAEAAGHFGLGMSIAQAVAGFMSVWLNCKVPTIAALTAERRLAELHALFRVTKHSAAVVAVLAGGAALLLVRLLAWIDPALGDRIPPLPALVVLMAAAVLQQYVLTVAVFARAQQREPLLAPSLLIAVATPALLAWLVPSCGALGAAFSYLLPVLLLSAPFSYAANREVVAFMADEGAARAPVAG